MKKLLIALMLVTVASLAFGQSLSAGLGFQVGPDWQIMTIGDDADNKMVSTGNNLGLGFSAFFDATYVQVSLGYKSLGFTGGSQKLYIDGDLDDEADVDDDDSSFSFFSVEALGKYPVALGGFTLNPLLGLGYDLCLGVKDVDGEAVDSADILNSDGDEAGYGYFNLLSLKLGVSADFDVGETFYVRPQALFGYTLYSPSLADFKDSMGDIVDYVKANNLSLDAGLLVGYKL